MKIYFIWRVLRFPFGNRLVSKWKLTVLKKTTCWKKMPGTLNNGLELLNKKIMVKRSVLAEKLLYLFYSIFTIIFSSIFSLNG